METIWILTEDGHVFVAAWSFKPSQAQLAAAICSYSNEEIAAVLLEKGEIIRPESTWYNLDEIEIGKMFEPHCRCTANDRD